MFFGLPETPWFPSCRPLHGKRMHSVNYQSPRMRIKEPAIFVSIVTKIMSQSPRMRVKEQAKVTDAPGPILSQSPRMRVKEHIDNGIVSESSYVTIPSYAGQRTACSRFATSTSSSVTIPSYAGQRTGSFTPRRGP
ncbi:hypothetical protein MSL71_7890 [Desulfoluna butyratoxydans]|uniref:Uncharacterized protein n=1 Tax=Desulfoluna butyratoxydans TaxID=231438 RepID=A0A4U8YHV6_9BACT|nr:hypothetical protein MSL71_7890 [Desulfoluna butyratoxydans]